MRTIVVTIAFLALAATAMTGCSNTMQGAGRDIEKAGQAIQNNF